MDYKLIINDIDEITTEEERKLLDLNLARLNASNFMFPVPINQLFDLYFACRFMEEKLKDKMFELRLDMDNGGKTTLHLINMNKNALTKQMLLSRKLQSALQRELDEGGIDFNVEEKSKMLMTSLRIERKKEVGRRKKFEEAVRTKNEVLNEINEIINGQEPNV